MPSQQVFQRFEASYTRIVSDLNNTIAFFDDFYSILVENATDNIREIFTTVNIQRIKIMLQVSFHELIIYGQTGQAGAGLKAHRESHRAYGIAAEDFACWMNAMLQAVQKHDPEVDQDILDAWTAVIQPGLTFMGETPR